MVSGPIIVSCLDAIYRRPGVFAHLIRHRLYKTYGRWPTAHEAEAIANGKMFLDPLSKESNASCRLVRSRTGEYRLANYRDGQDLKAMCLQEFYGSDHPNPELRVDAPLVRDPATEKWDPKLKQLHKELIFAWEIWTEAACELRGRRWWQSDSKLGEVARAVRELVLSAARLEGDCWIDGRRLTAHHLGWGELFDGGENKHRHHVNHALRLFVRLGLVRREEIEARPGRKRYRYELRFDKVDTFDESLSRWGIDPDTPSTWYKERKVLHLAGAPVCASVDQPEQRERRTVASKAPSPLMRPRRGLRKGVIEPRRRGVDWGAQGGAVRGAGIPAKVRGVPAAVDWPPGRLRPEGFEVRSALAR